MTEKSTSGTETDTDGDEYDTYSDASDSDEDSDDEIDFAGTILNNKYILINKIGGGSYSSVWLSYNINNKKFYATKVQNIDDYDDGLEEVRFLKELNKGKCLYLNKMIEHFKYKTAGGVHICMIFDLLAGSLYDVIKNGKYDKGLPINIVKKIIYQLLIAMNALNKKHKILHTDIKPENILIAGKSTKFEKIIKEFKLLNFHNKPKILKKKKKRKAFQTAAKQIVSDMTTIQKNKTTSNNNKQCSIKDRDLSEKNIIIKLADFGACCDLSNDMSYDIQTRYYRAPEIILRHKFNETCDMWSVGCVIYELLTGEILFEPDKKRRFNRDRQHIYDMQMLLGKLPLKMLEKCERKNMFFKKNGLMKGTYKLKYKSLTEKMLSIENIVKEDMMDVLDLMYKLFSYDPKDRPTAKKCLKHRCFHHIRNLN